VPLAERGVPVTGIELSGPMIERLRTKATKTRPGLAQGSAHSPRAVDAVEGLMQVVGEGVGGG
jgi:hypothetical protein